MTNEIKEIIDYLKDKDDYIEELGIAYKRIFINNGDLKALLDYITNLQEKIKNLDFDLDSYKSKYNNIKLHYEELAKENKELQQQKDKAVEYCNNNLEFTPRLIDVVDILRGDE